MTVLGKMAAAVELVCFKRPSPIRRIRKKRVPEWVLRYLNRTKVRGHVVVEYKLTLGGRLARSQLSITVTHWPVVDVSLVDSCGFSCAIRPLRLSTPVWLYCCTAVLQRSMLYCKCLLAEFDSKVHVHGTFCYSRFEGCWPFIQLYARS